MTRLFALVSYAYQSVVAIALIFAVSHILAPAAYTAFSLAVASSQLLCVLMFEWLQLAGVRFLAPARGGDAARLRWSLLVGAGMSAVGLLLVGGLAGLASPLSPALVVIGLALAILQGFADLQFMMVRVAGRLGAASLLMIVRASLLLVGGVAGAFRGDAAPALLGLACAQGIGLVLGWLAHASSLQIAPRDLLKTHLAGFCRYGMVAAGASVIHLSVPVMLRFLVIGRIGDSGLASAGFSMALDVLQRPFNVLVAAIHTVNYPDVVIQFEHGTKESARTTAARLFEFEICSTALMLGGIIAFLPDAGRLFVPGGILPSFLLTAPAATAFYFLHTQLQTTVAVVPHLQKSALRLVVIATFQLLATAAIAASALALGATPAETIALAACATASIILLAGKPTLQFGATPRPLLMGVTAAGTTLIGALSALPSYSLAWLLGKVALAGILTAIIAWQGDLLMTGKRRSASHPDDNDRQGASLSAPRAPEIP